MLILRGIYHVKTFWWIICISFYKSFEMIPRWKSQQLLTTSKIGHLHNWNLSPISTPTTFEQWGIFLRYTWSDTGPHFSFVSFERPNKLIVLNGQFSLIYSSLWAISHQRASYAVLHHLSPHLNAKILGKHRFT